MRTITTLVTAILLAGPAALPAAGQTTGQAAGQAMSMTATDTASMETSGMATPAQGNLTEPGQSAFAVIAEVIAHLEADPETDWTTVNIDALWAHLKDMDRVFTEASAQTGDADGAVRFSVTGPDDAVASIGRMVTAHAKVMQGVDGLHYQTKLTPTGAVMTVSGSADQMLKVRALGFAGVMASGMHHQVHHWMIATGLNPH